MPPQPNLSRSLAFSTLDVLLERLEALDALEEWQTGERAAAADFLRVVIEDEPVVTLLDRELERLRAALPLNFADRAIDVAAAREAVSVLKMALRLGVGEPVV